MFPLSTTVTGIHWCLLWGWNIEENRVWLNLSFRVDTNIWFAKFIQSVDFGILHTTDKWVLWVWNKYNKQLQVHWSMLCWQLLWNHSPLHQESLGTAWNKLSNYVEYHFSTHLIQSPDSLPHACTWMITIVAWIKCHEWDTDEGDLIHFIITWYDWQSLRSADYIVIHCEMGVSLCMGKSTLSTSGIPRPPFISPEMNIGIRDTPNQLW